MLVKIKDIEGRPKQVHLYYLMNSGKIPKHIDKAGYVCYDTDELKKYQTEHRRGRPPKIK